MTKLPILHVSKPIFDSDVDNILTTYGIDILGFIPHFLSSQNPTGGWHDYWDGLGNEVEEVIEGEKENYLENAVETDVAEIQVNWKVHETTLRDDLASAISLAEITMRDWVKTLPCGELIVNYPAYNIEESYVPDRIFITPCEDDEY